MRMHGSLGGLGKIPIGAQVLAYSRVGRERWQHALQYLRPGEVFSDSERAEIAAAFSTIPLTVSSREQALAIANVTNKWVQEIGKRLIPFALQLTNSKDASEVQRGKAIYRAWIPRDNDLQDFITKAAIVVGVGYALGPLSAASSGSAATGFAPGAGTFGTGAATTATGIGVPTVGAGGVLTSGAGTILTASKTFAEVALPLLKKLAIEQGVDYALSYAAEKYAESEQKKMAREMEADLRAQLEAAQREYDALIAAGTPQAVAASQAAGDSGKFGLGALILAALAALILLRRSP